jgi:hypothetical protein
MAGDLEDFLRRAAERRKAKAAQQKQQPQRQAKQPAQQRPAQQRPAQKPPQRRQPEYTDRRAERIVRPEPEPIPVAEVIEEPTDSLAARKRRLEEAKKAAERAKAEAAKRASSVRSASSQPTSSGTAPALTGDFASDLLKMLKHPNGIKQAILLREILDRPEHRW